LIVLDTSVVLTWFFPDETDSIKGESQKYVMQYGAIVPALWYYEVANGLLMAVRRNRIVPADGKMALGLLEKLSIECDSINPVAAWQAVLNVANTHALSAYDASFLELAMRRSLPLATLDKALLKAANSEGVTLLGGAA